MSVDQFMENVLKGFEALHTRLGAIEAKLSGAEAAPRNTKKKKAAKTEEAAPAAPAAPAASDSPTLDDAQRALREHATKYGIESAEALVASFGEAKKCSEIPEDQRAAFIEKASAGKVETAPAAEAEKGGLFG